MKKMVALVGSLSLLLAVSASAVGGSDEASNYSSGWNDTSTYGTGFSLWSFTQSGGYWVPDYSTDVDLSDFGDISSSDDSVLAIKWDSGYINASRDITSWEDGYTFSIDLATQWRTGARGIDLQDASDNAIFTFNVTDAGYGETGWDYRDDMVLSFTVEQNGANIDITVDGSSVGGAWSDTYTTSASGTLDGFSLFSGDVNFNGNNTALLANNMSVIPEPATIGFLLLGMVSTLFVRRVTTR